MLPTTPPKRVLICDDDLDYADECADGLLAYGFLSRYLKPGDDIAQSVTSYRPDYMVLDIYMPPPDGLEILNYLRSNPRAKEIGIALISGADDRLLAIAANLCGAYHLALKGTLRKPTKIRDIVALFS